MDKDKLIDNPFDQYQRYRAVTEILQIIKKQIGKKQLKILDVGGYFKNSKGQDVFPLKEFLPEDEIYVLDIAESFLPHYIQGSATDMPFLKNTFDVVNCQDVLEHIPAKERARLLGSLLNTTENFMILGAPFKTENSTLSEKILFEFILKALKGRHKELEEHILNGLPEYKEVESILIKKKVNYCEFPSGYLNNWLLMMIVKHYILALPNSQQLSTLIDRFYNLNFYESDQRPPAYRHMFVISKLKKNDYMLEKIADNFSSYREKYKYLTVEKSNFSGLQTLLNLEVLKDKNILEALKKDILEKEKLISDKDIHLQNYKKEVFEKTALILNLKNRIIDLKNRIIDLKDQLENKEVHIRNIETKMDMILESKVWRSAEFFRKVFYMKILKLFPALQRSILTITREGFRSFWDKVKKKELMKSGDLYDIWLKNNSLSEAKKRAFRKEMEQFSYQPKISIILPVYNVAEIWLEKAIDSVFAQLYENWELCIVDDASPKKHINEVLLKYKNNKRVKLKFLEENRGISQASNEALSLATGEFVGFLDHDDELSPDALYENVKILNQYPEAGLIYSDEDKINPKGKRIEPYFKPSWSPDLLLSFNYICHFSVYRKTMLDKIKGFRSGYEGSQDYDLLLRVTEKTDKIYHIPKILYHWRQIKGSTSTAHKEKITHITNSIKALQKTLQRRKIAGTVEKGINFDQFESYRVKRKLKQKPLISIIMPMKDKISYLKKNLKSIEEKTEYKNYEIVIVDNNSKEKETFDYLKSIEKKKFIRILQYKSEFNFSKINNYAVSKVKGEHILFLNNDIEVISQGWLTAMLEHSLRKEIGAVGAKLIFPNNTIQHAGTIVGLGGTAGHSHKNFPAESNGYFGALNTIRNYSAITAACMMIRKEVFDEVGRFDEKKLAVAFNDVDLCLKMRKKGYLIVYTPFAALYHHESLSRGYDLNPNEISAMNNRWGDILLSDPYYNPNLSLDSEDFKIKIN